MAVVASGLDSSGLFWLRRRRKCEAVSQSFKICPNIFLTRSTRKIRSKQGARRCDNINAVVIQPQ